MTMNRRQLISGAAIGGGGLLAGGLIGRASDGNANGDLSATGLPEDALAVARERGLDPADVIAALKTHVPAGKHDTHYLFASGGHSGQIWVYGVPSMRILKVIPVFGYSGYQGHGFSDESKAILKAGEVNDRQTQWGDTHHPALSETDGTYDGQFLFINDKAGGRIGVVDLRDFSTKQIVKNPLFIDDHGGPFVTPNTEYVIESGQYATPHGWKYAPLSKFKSEYRGAITYWKFDRDRGRIDPARSFAVEVPPYFQDLSDAGKGVSAGWSFTNSFNTEMATGGMLQHKPPLEVGASQHDMDYLHAINWRKAERVAASGKTETYGDGLKLIRLQTAIDEGLLYLVPEPKSPHGVDVTPLGDYFIISGKLDPHVTVYSFKKLQDAIARGGLRKDSFGVPIVDFEAVKEAQIEVGLGPLHTQFDNKGHAYTSLFLANQVARWTLGGPYRKDGWKLVDAVPIQYNVGHISAAMGDTTEPEGKYLVSLNKWSVDRFAPTGPHHTVNLQLIDISDPQRMHVLKDVPCPDGEPHYAQMCPVDKVKPWLVYPKTGWDAGRQTEAKDATKPGDERIRRSGDRVDVYATLTRSHISPDIVTVKAGDTVCWHLTNIERARNASHGFAITGHNVSVVLDPGETMTVTVRAEREGTFPYYCTEFCSALHMEMMGYMLVRA